MSDEKIDPIIETLGQTLGSLGYSPTDSLVLAYFMLNADQEFTQRDVERATWLRQPQVSLSINSLIDKKWLMLTSTSPPPDNHGRPISKYSVKMKPSIICDRMRDSILNEMDLKMRSVNKLDVILHASQNETIPSQV